MNTRKQRVDHPHRCIRTRGLSAAIQALYDIGPQVSLDKISEMAGCPKASLVRVFESKEVLLTEAFSEINRSTILAMRHLAQQAGGGRLGMLALISHYSTQAKDPSFRGCPLNSAADPSMFPWATELVGQHKNQMINLYVEILTPDFGDQKSLEYARAIALLADGLLFYAAAGIGSLGADAAIMTLRALLNLQDGSF